MNKLEKELERNRIKKHIATLSIPHLENRIEDLRIEIRDLIVQIEKGKQEGIDIAALKKGLYIKKDIEIIEVQRELARREHSVILLI